MQLPPELRAKLEQSLGFRLNDIEERALELARGADPGELTALEAELVVQLASKLKEPWLSRPGRYLLAAQDELYRGRGGPLANWAKAFAAFLGLAGLLSFCGWLFGEFDLRSLAPLGLLHLFAAPISLLANYERRRMLKLVETELPRSNIIERLGDNDPALLEIQAHTPVPFRWLLNTRLGTGRRQDRPGRQVSGLVLTSPRTFVPLELGIAAGGERGAARLSGQPGRLPRHVPNRQPVVPAAARRAARNLAGNERGRPAPVFH